MKLTSNLCQFLQSLARNRVSFQTKPDNRVLLFDAWSGPLEPPIGCLHFFSPTTQASAINLGEKKANVKRNAKANAQSKTIQHWLFQCGTAHEYFAQSIRACFFPG